MRAGVSQGAIAHVEGGFKDVSPELMAAIAMQTKFPLSFFTIDPPVEFSLEQLLFRAHAAMTRREGVEAARYAEILFEAASALRKEIEFKTSPLPIIQKEPQQAAIEARSLLDVPTFEPVGHLIDIIERSGVLVLSLPTTLHGRDAFSLWFGDQPILVLSNCSVGDRLRISVAHELGHLVMMHHQNWSSENERNAYNFAAEFLMPSVAFRRELQIPITLSGIAELKPRWRVSIQAMIRRAFDLKIIPERQYRYLFEQLSTKGWRTREPQNLDVPVERPRAFRKMAELLYGKQLDYPKMAADLRLRVEMVKEIINCYAEAPPTEKARFTNVVSFKRG